MVWSKSLLISKSVSYFLLVSIHDRYAQNGLSDEAMLLFAMKVEGVYLEVPDKITLIGMLSAAASIGTLEFGKLIEAYALEWSLQHDIYVGTALIDMYAKCGSMDNALRVFERMS